MGIGDSGINHSRKNGTSPSDWSVPTNTERRPEKSAGRWFAMTLGPNGEIRSVSKSFEELFHATPSSAIGRDFRDYVSSEDEDSIRECLDSLSTTSNDVERVKATLEMANGAIPFELSFISLSNETSIIGFHVMARESFPDAFSEDGPVPRAIADKVMSWTRLIVVGMDLDGRITTISRSTQEEIGYLREEVVGRPVTDFIVPREDVLDLRDVLRRVSEGEPVSQELAIKKKDGGTLEVFWRYVPIRNEDDEIIGIYAIGQEAPSLSRGLDADATGFNLEVLAEASTDLVESDDLADTIDRDLDKLVDSLGISFAVFRLLSVEAKPRMVCANIDFKRGRKLLESRVIGSGPLFKSVQDGNSFISLDIKSDPRIEIEGTEVRSIACLPIKYKREVYGCAVFASDQVNGISQARLPALQVFCNQVAISVRKARLKSELVARNRERESLYETSMAISSSLDFPKVLDTIIEKATELVKADSAYMFTVDRKRGILRCIASKSPYQAAIKDYELHIGEGITGIVAESGRGLLIERADQDGRAKQVEGTPEDPSSLISVPLKIGDEILGVVTLERIPGVPFNQADFRLIEMFSVQAAIAIHNATLFNKMNEHAQVQQMYNVLLTHDVANYNVPIHGYLEMLTKDPKLDERQRKYIKSALAQSENISALISDVRKLSMLRSLDKEPEFEEVDLAAAVSECVDALRMNTLYEEVEIQFNSPVKSAMVRGDAFVKDIVYNLLSNACKYGGGQMELELKEREEGGKGYWQLDVKDRGEGIPDDRKDFLFRRFDQFDVDTAAEGHGIGLSVVAALVERFNGKAWAEDRQQLDGVNGAVFSVTFLKADPSVS